MKQSIFQLSILSLFVTAVTATSMAATTTTSVGQYDIVDTNQTLFYDSTTHATYSGSGKAGTDLSFGRALGYMSPNILDATAPLRKGVIPRLMSLQEPAA